MPWKVTIVFPTRPIIGNALQMAEALSVTMEQITPDAPPPMLSPPPTPPMYQQRLTYSQQKYPNRNQTPSGSFPAFRKPDPDDTATREQIEDADHEGYTAFLESSVSPAEAMSPYPLNSTLDRAWKNGYGRAEHSDVRSDDDGI